MTEYKKAKLECPKCGANFTRRVNVSQEWTAENFFTHPLRGRCRLALRVRPMEDGKHRIDYSVVPDELSFEQFRRAHEPLWAELDDDPERRKALESDLHELSKRRVNRHGELDSHTWQKAKRRRMSE